MFRKHNVSIRFRQPAPIFMKYERFKQLWDALITDNPNVPPMKFEMTPTLEALIKYANGDTSELDKVRKFLGNGIHL